ncbi:hypothetical protein QTH89_01000 [Variovorax sp. J22G21]|uniref:hypothetical protein n=1 Tax=Variovorax fucosicus TaxID=3053517 RepID=UPI002575ABFB|nr:MULTISPECIES: hypothetical protein [unclassified Variovorax]MDM0042003.1 hypothetical protein [Variovorax sp. J22R193]MDM0059773.1 hypothetical protein [Variovorax sp. J22G21]
MNTYDVKTPSQLADEASATANEAIDSARNFAQASKGIAADAVSSLRGSAQDARQVGQDVVDAAGRKIDDIKAQVDSARRQGEQYVADQPVRAALMAAAGGAVLTALLISWMRGGRRR